jgi:hypothetical protein
MTQPAQRSMNYAFLHLKKFAGRRDDFQRLKTDNVAGNTTHEGALSFQIALNNEIRERN